MLGAHFDPGLRGKGLHSPGRTAVLSLQARQQSGWGMRASVQDVSAQKCQSPKWWWNLQAPRCFTHFLCPLPMYILFLVFISVLPMQNSLINPLFKPSILAWAVSHWCHKQGRGVRLRCRGSALVCPAPGMGWDGSASSPPCCGIPPLLLLPGSPATSPRPLSPSTFPSCFSQSQPCPQPHGQGSSLPACGQWERRGTPLAPIPLPGARCSLASRLGAPPAKAGA